MVVVSCEERAQPLCHFLTTHHHPDSPSQHHTPELLGCGGKVSIYYLVYTLVAKELPRAALLPRLVILLMSHYSP